MDEIYLTFFRSVIDNIADGIVVMDPNRIIFYHNPAIEEITKFTVLDIIGMNQDAFRSRHTTDEMLDDIWSTVDTKGSWKGEMIFTKADNKTEWHSYTSISRIYNETKEHIGYVGIFRDITEMKHAQTRLESSFAQLKQYQKKLNGAKIESINILLRASMAKDNDTGNHLTRIRHYSYELALFDGRSAEEAKQIGFSSILHDIGKLRIPDSILQKPDKLSEAEKIIMNKHTKYGYDILTESDTYEMDRQIALYHHESWDGSGYPEGKKREEIPYEARIVKIVDIFDALLSKRPYKVPWSRKAVLDFMKNEEGKSFDPTLLKKFFQLEEQGTLRKIQEQFLD